MKRGKRWLLLVSAVLFLVLVSQTEAVQPFRRVSIATTAATSLTSTTTTSTTTTELPTAEAGKSDNSTLSAAAAAAKAKNSKLTGIPQIDYIWDPNLPRELRGYNLSSYPFFSSVPAEEDITFKCEGHHDGFYASIEHNCQLYHHCVYGIRHDFLCANFTAFDQKTFICHFVSDVDCENSFKYWNRNDDLYMATTTSSTTTTTTEPPPTPRRRPMLRPGRPLRRPMNRRPLDDYYYEDVEYDDEYYEERLNSRRRKQRPRPRKPTVDYGEEYEDEKRSFGDEDQPRRASSRDRYRDDEEQVDEEYDVDRRKYDRPNVRPKPPSLNTDKRKPSSRKPGATNERRSFGDNRPVLGRKDKIRPVIDDPVESEDVAPLPTRRLAGRRRIGEKRTVAPPGHDAEEEDEHSVHAAGVDEGVAPDEESDSAAPREKLPPKPIEELVTPKAASSSVYARPRAPPRIARPVPVDEKKKFQYTVQKPSATTASPLALIEDEDYYEDELVYEEPAVQPVGNPRRRAHGDDDLPPPPPTKKRGGNPPAAAGRTPLRTTLRKPTTDKKHLVVEDDVEYDSAISASNERLDSRQSARKHPFNSRNRGPFTTARGSEDVDFVDDDYDERPLRPAHRLRPNKVGRKNLKKPRPQFVEDEEEPLDEPEPERPLRSRSGAAAITGRRKNLVASQRQRPSTAAPLLDDASDPDEELEDEPEAAAPSKSATSNSASGRPNMVRVVKRPFLPSRGGSPYLPRGLQPVGVALKPQNSHTTDSTPIDMGSTISGVRLLEHGAPILRDSGAAKEAQGPRMTLPPRSTPPVVMTQTQTQTGDSAPPPKVTLDELYENDYDVTLNDALNPTLKPLTSHQSHLHNRNYPSAFALTADAFVDNNSQSSPATHHNNNNFQNLHSNAYQSLLHSPQSLSLSQTQSQASSQASHQHQHPQTQQQQPQQQQQPNYNSDSYFSSTDLRRRAIVPASAAARSSSTDVNRGVSARIAQHFYEDLEY